MWNPWHGCHKISPGCVNCYVYRRDSEFGKDSTIVSKTSTFNLPMSRTRKGEYKFQSDGDLIFTCGTSDFFLEEADEWREEAWRFIRERKDLGFMIITKRINRFQISLPSDWGYGYDNVHIGCTAENQKQADYRLPIFLEMPIKHKFIVHEPMLEAMEIGKYLSTGNVEHVICGGESGPEGRICDYEWILNTRNQCVNYNTPFHFKQTGTHFKKGNKVYTIERKNQIIQAVKAGIDYLYV